MHSVLLWGKFQIHENCEIIFEPWIAYYRKFKVFLDRYTSKQATVHVPYKYYWYCNTSLTFHIKVILKY